MREEIIGLLRVLNDFPTIKNDQLTEHNITRCNQWCLDYVKYDQLRKRIAFGWNAIGVTFVTSCNCEIQSADRNYDS